MAGRFSGFEKSMVGSFLKGARVAIVVRLGCRQGRRVVGRFLGASDTFHKLASALEHVGGFIGELAAAFEHLLAALVQIAALVGQHLASLVGLFGDSAPDFSPGGGGVQKRDGGAHSRARYEPDHFTTVVFVSH